MSEPVPEEATDLAAHVERCWGRYSGIQGRLRRLEYFVLLLIVLQVIDGHSELAALMVRLVPGL